MIESLHVLCMHMCAHEGVYAWISLWVYAWVCVFDPLTDLIAGSSDL